MASAKDDRGEVPIFMVLLATVFLLLYISIHGAMVFHGQSVVSAAAQDGLRAAQLEGGTESDGQQAAEATAAYFQGLSNVQIDVDRTDEQVTVKVTATVETPTFGFANNVSAEVSGPTERFIKESERT